MNPFKNHDWKHVLAYVACVAILGVCQIQDVHPYQTTILMIALPLFTYAGVMLPQAGYGSSDAAKALASAKQIGPAVVLVFALGLSAIGLGAVVSACTKQQTTQVEQILPNGANCIEKVIEDVNGAIDIGGTLQSCGVTIEQLVVYLEDYFSKDAGGAAGASPEKVQRAGKLLDAARAYQKAHAS